MKMTKLGRIGHGKLGKAFLETINDRTNYELVAGHSRSESVAITADVDQLAIMMKPQDVGAYLRDTREQLKNTMVISFAAAVPRSWMESLVDDSTTIVRAMCDIDFQQIICEESDAAAETLAKLSEYPLIETRNEIDIDTMTTLVGCLPGVCAWQIYYRGEQAREWLRLWQKMTFEKIGVPMEITDAIVQKAYEKKNLLDVIKEVATPGGVTASIVSAMSRGEMDHERLFQTGMRQIQHIAEDAMKH